MNAILRDVSLMHRDDTTRKPDALDAFSECFHCGLPVPENTQWSVEIDHLARAMCCPGCQAVAQAIVEYGATDYYHTRSVLSATAAREDLIPPELKLYDSQEWQDKFSADTNTCEATFSIEGMRCAACVWLIEKRLASVPGVLGISLNVATERLHMRWDKKRCNASGILTAVHEVGYIAYPFDAIRQSEQLRLSSRKLFRQLFIAGLSMMQVMMYALPVYIAADGMMEADMANLMRWAGLVLTTPAIFYSAQPFFRGAWAGLRNRTLGMDVPVALGITAAFAGSVIATWRGHGDVYFDSVTMFIFLLLCSRYLELSARRKAASALENMQHVLLASALHMPDYPVRRDTWLVAATQLVAGDVILVKPGETIAADGILIEGASAIDVSLLTGESRMCPKTPGDFLPGGAINAVQAILMRVTKPVHDSTLSTLIKLSERDGSAKPKLALWADKVASGFVAVLLLFAVGVFIFWHSHDPSHAWQIAVAVLVVSCPCALSLATPTALAAATDRLLRQGVLVVQSHVMETLQRTTHILFDKTGTLTEGHPSVRAIDILSDVSRFSCLRIAAALEAGSAHPLSHAIIEAAKTEVTKTARATSLTWAQAQDLDYVVGQGVQGIVDGAIFRLGSSAFVETLAGEPLARRPSRTMSSIYLGREGKWLARFDLSDAIRHDACEVIEYFRSLGKTVILLSGDHQGITQRLAVKVGITDAYGEYLPEQKLAFVQALQSNGAVVAMVGDGINDAAVLRAADVSFAMGSGAALTQAHADAVLMSGRLSSFADTARLASETMSVVHQNLVWAVFYNAVAIPAAAMGLLNPWMSGVGMALSSVVVVVNALRLRRIPKQGVDQYSASLKTEFVMGAGTVS